MTDPNVHPGIFPSVGAAAPDDETVKGPLASLAYLVGGVWKATTTATDGTVTEVKEWIRWAVEGWVLHSIQITTTQGSPPIRACGMMSQDPCDKRIVMTKLARTSTATGKQDLAIVVPPGTTVFVGKTDACTVVQEWRQHMRQVGENTMVTVTELKLDGSYDALPPVTFERSPDTGEE